MAQRYEKYKDSGVQWLGEIPSHWKLVRVKSLLEERTEKSKTGTEEPLSMSQKYGIIPTKEMDVVPNAASSYVGAKHVYVGDIVFNKLKAHLGVFAISKYEGLVSPDYAVYYSKGLSDKQYIEYQFHTPLYIQEFKRHATGVAIGLTRLYTNQLYAIQSVCPPLEEQKSIVSYLDNKCSMIDEWVSKKEKEVEYLQELKQRLIADAVTMGLNPEVKMKHTNISWLPKVPEHWECIKMKYLFNERSEKNHPDEVSLCATQTYGVIPQKLYCSYGNRVVEVSKGFELLKFVKEGDFVIHLRSFQGGIEYAYYQGIISPAYTILEPKDANNSPYLKILFKSYNFIQLLKTCVTGIREGQNINYSMLGNKYLFIPPLEEQKQIVSHITDKTSKIEKLIANINREIDGIKEYKQRLISDVVTGQIKVC